jgi:glycosyltransferase involved in cell wall biosynthesis
MNTEIRPLVTIGIPTYNHADAYLRETLRCALEQTYSNLEIIVADNYSSDETEGLVRDLGDSRVRYFRHERNIPPNDNFNFCLQQARGKYFQLLHDDDTIDSDFVELCMQAVEVRPEVGIIRTGARIIDSHGKTISEMENNTDDKSAEELFIKWLHSRTWMFLCAVLFNTARLKECGGFNSKHQLFQDVLAEFTLAARYGWVDIPAVKAGFRKHAGQRTAAARVDQWCEDSIILLRAMCDMAPIRRNEIWAAGLEHFSKHNYDLASSIRSPVDRYSVYLTVYRTFDYAYSPLRFFGTRAYRRLFTWLGRVKRFMRGKTREAY